ncbi:MAG: DNA repair protein RadA [Thermodesulfobacteriota bacterium]|nr:DNA repair protein RadA [Thermodesulfobacteriota bacterium]
MAKIKTTFICTKCGYRSPKWLGRCPDCRSWDTLSEEIAPAGPKTSSALKKDPQLLRLDNLPPENQDRLLTGLDELDRVFGGGVVPGSVALLAGEPGIGKSTLLLQAAAGLSRQGRNMLYVSGEESPAQLRLRANRLGLDLSKLQVAAETSVEAILTLAVEQRWDILAVDSIQAVSAADLPSGPGSLAQIRESAGRFINLAKTENLPVWLVGHVTKEGTIAGPKVLEHMVDTVLYFEGERGYNLRILRAFKNRFGSVNEIGVFEMKDQGLAEVANPSALFLAERPGEAAGSVVAPTIEGTRPILVELQALVSASGLAMPRRQALGIDPARLSLLTAVLEKKVGLRLFDKDVFVNVAGGIKVVEPAVDLGMVAAIASSYNDRPVDREAVFLGEVGLAGEVRGVSRLNIRLKEAAKLGFKKVLLPQSDKLRLGQSPDLELIGLSSVADLLEWLS